MASRLSAEPAKVDGKGLKGVLAAMASQSGKSEQMMATIGYGGLSHLPEEIENLSTQSLIEILDDCSDQNSRSLILKNLSQEQSERLIDYVGWKNQKLNTRNVLSWLEEFKFLGPGEYFRRFAELDEEVQIASLAPFLRCFSKEEFELLDTGTQDKLQKFPGEEIFYEIDTEDKELEAAIIALLEDGFASGQTSYVFALVCHSAYMPPNESEFQALRFRNARLSEDGFVPLEEGTRLFEPLDHRRLKSKMLRERFSSGGSNLPSSGPKVDSGNEFVREVFRILHNSRWNGFETLPQSLAHLANVVSSACGVEAYDAKKRKQIAEKSKGLFTIGLQFISDNDTLTAARLIENGAHLSSFFQVGASLLHELKISLAESLAKLPLAEVDRFIRKIHALKYEVALNIMDKGWVDILGFERLDSLKGLFNRFPSIKDQEDPQIAAVNDWNTFAALTERVAELKREAQVWLEFAGKRLVRTSLDMGLLRSTLSELGFGSFSKEGFFELTGINELARLEPGDVENRLATGFRQMCGSSIDNQKFELTQGGPGACFPKKNHFDIFIESFCGIFNDPDIGLREINIKNFIRDIT